MKNVIGLALIVAGIAFGAYAGIWWAFIGGIVDVINEIRAYDLSAVAVAIGVAKVVFASVIGYVAACIFIIPGYAMIR